MMTQRERELEAAIIAVALTGRKLCDSIQDVRNAELDHTVTTRAEQGSEEWLRSIERMTEAWKRVKEIRTEHDAALREAKDTLYAEPQKAVA